MPADAAHAPFLEEILTHPHDVAPRLVYADWLLEQGDPRGEFVHVQCTLDELDAWDPRRPELERREAALLKKHRRQWSADLKPLVTSVEFRRGFVEHVSLKVEQFVDVADELFRLAPIRSVKLGGDRLQLVRLHDCEALQRVTSLSVSSMRLGASYCQPLFECPHLKNLVELDLFNNGLGGGGMRHLVECPHLPRLERLNLDQSRLLEEGTERLLAWETLGRLTHLSLEEAEIEPVGLESLAGSRRFQRLEWLNLNPAGREWVEALAASGGFAPKWLDLFFSYADVSGLRALAEAGCLNRIEYLNLSYNFYFQDEGAELLASVPMPNLRELDVSECNLGERGIEALLSASWIGHVRRLVVGGNRLSPESMQLLSASPELEAIVSHEVRLRDSRKRSFGV